MAKQYPLNIVIGAVDKASATLRRVNDRLSSMTKPLATLRNSFAAVSKEAGLQRVADATGAVARNMTKIAAVGAAAGAGMAAVFKSQFVDTAAKFEKFGLILETLEGSSDKAKKSMAWVSDFAAKTPYDLEQVMESFVKLKAYGLDPINKGLLKTLGDTSAGIGKDLMQAVEAIADAMTGENERLKDFGIKASKTGNRIVYEYTANGKTMRKAANANNRAMIQSTLQAIWNEKYGGAMDKLSNSWGGMTSNLGDQWTRFKVMVMESGAFDWLKGRLSDLLKQIDDMAKSGELKALAEAIGTKIVNGLKAAWEAGKQFVQFLKDAREALDPFFTAFGWLVEKFGLFNTVATAAAVVIGGQLIAALASMSATLVGLGVSMSVALAVPALIVAGIAAVVAAGYYLIKNWDTISAKWNEIWTGMGDFVNSIIDGLKQLLIDFFNWHMEIISKITGSITNAGRKIKGFFSWGDDASAGPALGPQISAPTLGNSPMRRDKVDVTVDFKNLPQGVRTESQSTGGIPLMVNRGFALPGVRN
jgi:phage tail tape-measure protein